MYKSREGGWLSLIAGATAVFLILYLFALIAAYFWAHKPFDLPNLLGIGRTLSSIGVWLGLLWLAAALGEKLSANKLWQAETVGLMSLVFDCGLGLAVLSLLTLGLGLAGLLQPMVAWGMALLLVGLLWRDLTAVLPRLRQLTLPRPQTRFEQFLALYSGGMLGFAFLRALTPATAWDALLYHLTVADIYLAAGNIHHTIDFALLGFPQLIELQYLLGMLLIGDGVAPLIHFTYGLFGLLLAVDLARRTLGRATAWLTAVMLLAVPTFVGLLSVAYVDLALLFYTTAVFHLFYHQRNPTKLSGYIAIGLFCGFATSTKYTGLAIPIAITANLLWSARQIGWQLALKRLAVVSTVTTLVTLPGLLENWLTSGNPVYPFLFASPFWDPWRAWFYAKPDSGLWLTAPWRLLTAAVEATILGTTGTEAFGATIGPFILGALFLLPLVWRNLTAAEKRLTGQILLFVGMTYLLWLLGMARSGKLLRTRLILLPAFSLTAVLAALTLAKLNTLSRPQLDVGWLSRVVIALTLSLLIFAELGQFSLNNPLPFILGFETADHYRLRQLGSYQAAINHINQLPADTNVQFLWEPRSYGCHSRCQPDLLLDTFYHATRYLGQDADELAATWARQGVTHVLINQRGLEFQAPAALGLTPKDDIILLEILLARHFVEIEQWGETYTLYQWQTTLKNEDESK